MNVPGEGCSSLQPPWVLALCMRSQTLPRSPSVVAPTAPLASCSPWLIVWSSWDPRAGWKHAGPMHVASRVHVPAQPYRGAVPAAVVRVGRLDHVAEQPLPARVAGYWLPGEQQRGGRPRGLTRVWDRGARLLVGVQERPRERVRHQPTRRRQLRHPAGGGHVDGAHPWNVRREVAGPGEGVGSHHHLHLGQPRQLGRRRYVTLQRIALTGQQGAEDVSAELCDSPVLRPPVGADPDLPSVLGSGVEGASVARSAWSCWGVHPEAQATAALSTAAAAPGARSRTTRSRTRTCA